MFKKEETKKVKNSLLITHPNALPTTRGQRAADRLTKIAGSWSFIIGFLIFLVLWMMTNVIWLEYQSWDPYPFILLILDLSSFSALPAPILLMSQNRENERDRQRAEYDYAVNRKAEREIEEIKKSVERIERKTK